MADDKDVITPVTLPQHSRVVTSVQGDLPAVSPTGSPIIPQWLTIAGSIVIALAGLALGLPTMGVSLPPTVVAVCSAIVALGSALGVASPGVRTQPKQ